MRKPYKYFKIDKDYEYHFSTKNGISYIIKLSKDETFNSVTNRNDFNTIFQIVIAKVSTINEPLDLGVSATISEIITNFLLERKNSIIYFCSYFDKKELKRFNTFNRWYQFSDSKNEVDKIDNVIKIDEVLFYTSLIFHQKNPQKEDLLVVYDSLEELLNKEK